MKDFKRHRLTLTPDEVVEGGYRVEVEARDKNGAMVSMMTLSMHVPEWMGIDSVLHKLIEERGMVIPVDTSGDGSRTLS